MQELPRYRCHKVVGAVKIEDLIIGDGGVWRLYPVESEVAPFSVSGAWFKQHNPQIGGYYVRYEDGYASYSPAGPFESGYTRIEESVGGPTDFQAGFRRGTAEGKRGVPAEKQVVGQGDVGRLEDVLGPKDPLLRKP